MTITANSIKSAIKTRLLEMAESRYELINQASRLSSLGVDVKNTSLYIGSCLESVTDAYITNLCRKLTAEHAGGTPAEIRVDPDLYKIISDRSRDRDFSYSFHEHVDGDMDADKEMALKFLNAVDFEKIAEVINEQMAALVETGLNIFAKKIISLLNLESSRGYYEPYRGRSNRIVCPAWAFNYYDSHSKIRDLLVLKNAFEVVEREAALSFGVALDEYIQAAQQLNWQCEKIPSRSVFGKGGHLEIHCFKDKHEYRFSIQTFDAILAFLTINGEADIAEKLMSKTGLLEAA
jgi:hypothetical protein